jgi:hypothetical protein
MQVGNSIAIQVNARKAVKQEPTKNTEETIKEDEEVVGEL